MRTRLAIFFCSLAAICTAGLVFLPSSESSIAKPVASEPEAPELIIDMIQNHPKGYALKSVLYEDNGRPLDPKERDEKLAQIHKRLKELEERRSRMSAK